MDIISKYGEPKFDIRTGSWRYRVLFYYQSDKTVVVVCEYGIVKEVEKHDFIPFENIAPYFCEQQGRLPIAVSRTNVVLRPSEFVQINFATYSNL